MFATVTVTELDVLGFKLLLPEYDAVTLLVPAGSEEVANVAFPPDNVTGEPKLPPLIRNCIVPVADDGDTIAVKVTDFPNIIEVAFELKVVVEETCIGFTVNTNVPLALEKSVVSPRYFATISWLPTDNDDVINVALPPDIVPVPNIVDGVVLLSLNCTVPVADDGDTIDVKFTDLPNIIDVAFELKEIVVEALFTVCTSIPLTLGLFFASPRYLATILCDPTEREYMENVVLPVMPSVPVPMVVGGLVLVSLNCTVPVALLGVTKAVNFTK